MSVFETHRRAITILNCVAHRSRENVFYTRLGISDTLDGRFDLLTFHLWLVLVRLQGLEFRSLSQMLIDRAFETFEGALREQGAGDGGALKGVRAMAEAFGGRIAAYESATDLAPAILRNVYRLAPAAADGKTVAAAETMADYARAAAERLQSWIPGKSPLDFGPLPG